MQLPIQQTLLSNGSIDSGSNYNVHKTSSYFYASHEEGGSNGQVSYNTNNDLAQGTGFQIINEECANDGDALDQEKCIYLVQVLPRF